MDAGGSRGIKPKGEEPGSGLPSGRLFFPRQLHINTLSFRCVSYFPESIQ